MAAAGLLLGLAGCSSDEPVEAASPPTTTEAAPSPDVEDAQETAAEPTPIEGEWVLSQKRRDVIRHLKKYGFGDVTDRFLRVENVFADDRWRWVFDGGRFYAYWQNPDGSWKTADYGDLEVHGNRALLHFGGAVLGNTTTFKWRMEGDQLWLDWRDYTGGPYKGLPDEAFWRAYLTKPLTRAS